MFKNCYQKTKVQYEKVRFTIMTFSVHGSVSSGFIFLTTF